MAGSKRDVRDLGWQGFREKVTEDKQYTVQAIRG